MQQPVSSQGKQESPFSPVLFLSTIVLTLVVYVVIVHTVAPRTFVANIQAPWWRHGIVFLCAHLFCAFAEYFFHRYVLHMPLLPGLAYFYRQHTLHHDLTNIRLVSVREGKGKVFNRYPILDERQHEASFFPWYTLGAFVIIFMPITVVLQMIFPSWPIILVTPFAMAFSLVLYELIHAIEHLDFRTFWEPKVTHERWGKWWTVAYCFHLRHHAHRRTNEGISGFFTLPIPDVLFGTYAPWPRAFMHGDHVEESSFSGYAPRPRWLIRTLDHFAISYLARRGIVLPA